MNIKNKLGKERNLQIGCSQERMDDVSDAVYTFKVDIPAPKCIKCFHNVNAKWYTLETCLPIYWKCLVCKIVMNKILSISFKKTKGERFGSMSVTHVITFKVSNSASEILNIMLNCFWHLIRLGCHTTTTNKAVCFLFVFHLIQLNLHIFTLLSPIKFKWLLIFHENKLPLEYTVSDISRSIYNFFLWPSRDKTLA